MQINKTVQCVSCIDTQLVKLALHFKKARKANTEILTKVEHKNSVPSMKQVHLQVPMPIKMGYLPLMYRHVTLSGDSVTTLCHNQLPFSTKIAEYIATKLLIRHSETSQEMSKKMIKHLLENQ